MSTGIPADVAAFIRRHILSLEEMELLCVLVSDAKRAYSAGELTQRLGSTEGSINRRLRHLVEAGLVATTAGGGGPAFRFAAAGPELDRLAVLTVATYRSHRLSVTSLIYDLPKGPLSSFADSFRLRKEDQ